MKTNRTVSQRSILNLGLPRLGLVPHCRELTELTEEGGSICKYKGIGCLCITMPNSRFFYFISSYQWFQVMEILNNLPIAWLQIVNVINDELYPAVRLNAKQERNYSFGRTYKALKFLQPFSSVLLFFFTHSLKCRFIHV